MCGNPLVPAWLVNLLICMTWWMRYWVGPLMKDMKSKSLVDVMLLRFAKIEGLEFGFFLLISVLGWLLFIFQNNAGPRWNCGRTILLSVLFLFFFLALACIIIDVLFPAPAPASSSTTTSPPALHLEPDRVHLQHRQRRFRRRRDRGLRWRSFASGTLWRRVNELLDRTT